MRCFGFNKPSFSMRRFGFAFSRFTPANLFANGEQGVWFDPSDLSTMFQDARGVEPVTKDGDPVGLILDKSQGLEGAITNVAKPFMDDVSNEFVEVTNTSDGTKIVIKQLSNSSSLSIFEVGKTYSLSVVYSIPESSDDIPVYNSGAGASNFLFSATKGVKNRAEVTLTARSKSIYLRTGSGEITIHEIVLKEIEGNHATQETAASRPIYRTDGELHWLEFDGVDDYLISNLFEMPQPFSITLSIVTAKANGLMNYFDSLQGDRVVLWSNGIRVSYGIFAGRDAASGLGVPYMNKDTVTCLFNGTTSSVTNLEGKVENLNPGVNALSGVTVGSRMEGASGFVPISLYSFIVSEGEHANNTRSFSNIKAGVTV